MSDAVAFACFRVLFVAHNKRMKELLHEHIVTLFNLNYGVAVEKSIPPEKKQSLKKENNPSCICSKDWASSQKLRRMFSRCINTMARSSALPVLMLPNITRLDNAIAQIPKRLAATTEHLATVRQQIDAARAEAGKPFPQEAELRTKSARLAELDAALNMDRSSGSRQKDRSEEER